MHKLYLYTERESAVFVGPTLVRIRNPVSCFFIPLTIEITFKTLLFFNALKSENEKMSIKFSLSLRPPTSHPVPGSLLSPGLSLFARRPCRGREGVRVGAGALRLPAPRRGGGGGAAGGGLDPHPGGGVGPAPVTTLPELLGIYR